MLLMAAAGLLAVVIVAIEVRDWRRRRKAKQRGQDSLVSEPKPLTKAEAQARSARREGTKRTGKKTTTVVVDSAPLPVVAAPVAEAPAKPKTAVVAAPAAPAGPAPKPVVSKVAATAPSSVQGAVVPKAFLNKAKEQQPKGDPEVRDVRLVRDVAVAPRDHSQGVTDEVPDAYDFTRSARQWKPASLRNQSTGPVFVDAPIMMPASAPPIIGQGDESEEELEALRERFEEESRKLERSAVDAALSRRSARNAAVDSLPDNSGDTPIPEIRSGVRALSQRAPAAAPAPVDAASKRMAAAIAATVLKVSAPPPNTALTPMPPPVASVKKSAAPAPLVQEVSDFDAPQGADALVAAAMAGAPGLDDDSAEIETGGTETWVAKLSSRREVASSAPEQVVVSEPVINFHADVGAIDVSSRIRMVEEAVEQEVEAEAEPEAEVADDAPRFADVTISRDTMVNVLRPVSTDSTISHQPVPSRDPSDPESFDLIRVGHASAKMRRIQAEESARQNAAETDVDEDAFDLHRQPLRIVRDTSSVRLESEDEVPVIRDGVIAPLVDEPVRASDSMIVPAVTEGDEAEAEEVEKPAPRRSRLSVAQPEPVPTSQRVNIADEPIVSDEAMIDDDSVMTDDTPVNMAARPDDEEKVDIYMDLNSESMRAPMVDIEPSMIDDVKVVVPLDLLEPGMGEDDDSEAEAASSRGSRRRSARR